MGGSAWSWPPDTLAPRADCDTSRLTTSTRYTHLSKLLAEKGARTMHCLVHYAYGAMDDGCHTQHHWHADNDGAFTFADKGCKEAFIFMTKKRTKGDNPFCFQQCS